MPSVSSLQPEDKAQIKSILPKTSKILTATVARVFYQRGDRWAYSGIQGGLCLVVDKQRGGVWFRVVDLLVRRAFARTADVMGGREGRDRVAISTATPRLVAISPSSPVARLAPSRSR